MVEAGIQDAFIDMVFFSIAGYIILRLSILSFSPAV